jgi:hypothetical protein
MPGIVISVGYVGSDGHNCTMCYEDYDETRGCIDNCFVHRVNSCRKVDVLGCLDRLTNGDKIKSSNN